MMIGIIQSQNVHLNRFGVHVVSRANYAQSHQRRFRRWLSNRRIDVAAIHYVLMAQSLSQWGNERMYLSLDTTVVWNCCCIVWVGVADRRGIRQFSKPHTEGLSSLLALFPKNLNSPDHTNNKTLAQNAF
jgi:hypothetical protein